MIQPKIYTISGMDCGSCAVSIEMFFSNQPGVKSAKVNFETKELVLEFSQGEFDFVKSKESLKQMGYTLTPKI